MKAIHTAHEQAPLAKIVLVDPIFYNVSGSALGSRNYIDIPAVRKLTVEDFIRVNAPEWLSHCTWGLQPKADYSSDNKRWTLVTSSRANWLDDDSILVDGETLAAQKIISDTAFAEKYVSDYSFASGASYGHMNTLYNELYFAPKFANLICDTLGISGYYLPEGLKCNNLTYEAPGTEPEPDPEPEPEPDPEPEPEPEPPIEVLGGCVTDRRGRRIEAKERLIVAAGAVKRVYDRYGREIGVRNS